MAHGRASAMESGLKNLFVQKVFVFRSNIILANLNFLHNIMQCKISTVYTKLYKTCMHNALF